MNEENKQFNDVLGKKLTMKDVVSEIIGFMKADSLRQYKLIIGSDSQRLEDKSADFVTAVVTHRVGNGGRYFWRRMSMGKFHTLRDRIIQEALFSIDTAKEILITLKEFDTPVFSFEIHVDVGENGPTKDIIQEVVGMIRANNFEVKTKPYSYAASKVADRHV
ncbi:MAG: ribonuclease H-like YkuK family protein [Patescibacteria group bacterium]